MDLLLEVIKGGNKQVQLNIYQYIVETDQYNKVITHIELRLLQSLQAIKERKDEVAIEYKPMSNEQINQFLKCCKTFIFLKELCEGHCNFNQNLLRNQSLGSCSTSINLILIITNILVAQCESSKYFIKLEKCEVELIIKNLYLIIELIRGMSIYLHICVCFFSIFKLLLLFLKFWKFLLSVYLVFFFLYFYMCVCVIIRNFDYINYYLFHLSLSFSL